MSRVISMALAGAMPALLLAACGGDDGDAKIARQADAIVSLEGETACLTLYAGQHIDAGTVCVTVDAAADTSADCGEGATGAMQVTYTTAGDWTISEAHLAAGDSLDDIPTTRNGSPIPGQFPYNSGDISGATTHSFTVPLCTFGLDGAQDECEPVTAFVAAHAALRRDTGDGTTQSETGWADGTPFVERGNWAEYATLELTCAAEEEPPPPEDGRCETAWAFTDDAHAFCNTDIDGDGRDESRWGWYAELAPGSYSFDLYAAAGQCDIERGARVGSLGVEYDGATATVTYTLDDGIGLRETHLYVGAERQTTLAPGQLGYQHERLDDAAEDSYGIAIDADPIFLSAHAVVCGVF
ncbi:MAG: hypothetical protein R3F65_00965 [bacterium]